MMKLQIWSALARGVVLESIRRKDLWVVAVLGFVIISSASAFGFYGTSGLQSFAKDLSSTVLGAFSTILAVVVTCRLIPDEVKNRTLYPLLARPISRFDLIFGKFLGAVAVSWIAFLILSALTAVALSFFRVSFEPIMAQYLLCKMMGLVVVCAVALAVSVYATPSASVTLSLVILLGSGMLIQGMVISASTASPEMRTAFQVLNAIVPQVKLFDLGSRAANMHWGPVPILVVGTLAVYMVAYSSAMLGLSWAKFRKLAV